VMERDDGIVVSGAKMLATGSALTHATFVAQNSAVTLGACPSILQLRGFKRNRTGT